MNNNYQPNYGYNNSPSASQQYTSSNTSQPTGQSMSSSVENLASTTANSVNYLLQNEYARMFIFVVAIVYASHTLMPVPKNLEKMFRTSNLFKYVILFLVAASMLHPLDETKVKICLIVPLFVLFLFKMLRNHSSGKSLFSGFGSRFGKDDECSDSEKKQRSSRSSRSPRSPKSSYKMGKEKKPKREKKGDKKSSSSDSVKGVTKTEHFSII